MSLSPDECKWSERLTLTQQGMRCGFTGTGVCAWCDVLEEVAMSTVWNTVEKEGRQERVIYACVYHSRFLATPLPLELWPPLPTEHPTGRHTDPREKRSVFVDVYLCVLLPQINSNTFVYFPLDSVLRLNFSWPKNMCESQVVLFLSQAHLHPFDPMPCYLIATRAVYSEEPARFYHLAVQPHAFTSLHHEHPHMQAYTHSSSNEISLSPMLSVLQEHKKHNRVLGNCSKGLLPC